MVLFWDQFVPSSFETTNGKKWDPFCQGWWKSMWPFLAKSGCFEKLIYRSGCSGTNWITQKMRCSCSVDSSGCFVLMRPKFYNHVLIMFHLSWSVMLLHHLFTMFYRRVSSVHDLSSSILDLNSEPKKTTIVKPLDRKGELFSPTTPSTEKASIPMNSLTPSKMGDLTNGRLSY